MELYLLPAVLAKSPFPTKCLQIQPKNINVSKSNSKKNVYGIISRTM